MANKVKGLLVEIGGDTSGLQNALKKVNSATASLSKELKGINSLLKLDPENVTLLNQKQVTLNESIKATEEQLKANKEIYDEAVKAELNGAKISEENWRAIEREIAKNEAALRKLKLEASNWTQAGRSIEQWGEKVSKTGDSISKVGSTLTKTLTTTISAVSLMGLTYNAQIEKYETAFKTFLGSEEKAAKAIQKIKEDAAKTPFDTASLTQANQMLISTGVSAEDSREAILALGEAVVATGGGNDELTRMSANLQQIRNAGKATALDIKQFAYAGIDVYGMLSEYTGKTTAEVKDMEVSYEDLVGALKKASSKGGKYFGAMEGASKTLTGQVSSLKSEFQDMIGSLTKSLMPVAKKVVARVKEWVSSFSKLSDSQKENIVRVGLLVAAIGPLVTIVGKLTSTVGNVAKGIGTFSQAIGVLKTGANSGVASVDNLAKVISGLTSPTGLAITAITTLAATVIAKMAEAEKKTRQNMTNMAESANEFYQGIKTAEGYLSSFNETMFVSSAEQQELTKQMDDIQKKITEICKTASDERRGYTQEEVTQLDEYFEKLRQLNEREIQIQQLIAGAITQQAKTNAETFKGSLEEYKEQVQQWLKTAEDQKSKTINMINEQTIQEIALLNQRYGKEANMQNEAYATEYNKVIENKQKKIDEANNEIAEISSVYTKGYAERGKTEEEWYEKLKENLEKQEKLEKNHNEEIRKIKNDKLWYVTNTNAAIDTENQTFAFHQKDYWKQMYKNMSESEAKQMGVWLSLVAETELYGGKIDDETRKIVKNITNSYDSMPKKTREAMKNAMSPMLEEMKKSEPSLYTKASGIADGILSRLKKSFDIHSPSRETRKIFKQVMAGAELGLEDEQDALEKQVNSIANKVKTDFGSIQMGALNQSVIDQTKTIFTTPTLNIYAQDELTPAKMNRIINTVNRRLGSQY